MNDARARKAERVERLHGVFKTAPMIVLAHYTGLRAIELDDMRACATRHGGRFHVTKNALALRAIAETPAAPLGDFFKGPTAIAWSDEPLGAAKALVEFSKSHEAMTILGGIMEGALLNARDITQLAQLPSLEVLRGRIASLLVAPASRLVGCLSAPAAQLARVCAAHAQSTEPSVSTT